MNELGTLILRLTFFTALIAFLLLVLFRKTGKEKHPGIPAGIISCAGVVISSVLLMVSLVFGIFSVEFVYHNTERSLPLIYKISAFWSGSAGSLLLWTFFFALLLLVIYFKNKNEKETKTVFGVILVFIINFMLVISFINNPFKYVTPETDGFGLNPALQSIGMVFHPPVILAGFSFFFIAFAYSFCDLRDKSDRNKVRAWKWTLWGWILLSAGIITGGLWAYTELGWGGYWAWDPIENSSMVNWLISTALLHTLSIKAGDPETKARYRRVNFILITLTVFTILIGTFIARSGILKSVHAYSNESIKIFLGSFLIILAVVIISIYTRLEKNTRVTRHDKANIDGEAEKMRFMRLLNPRFLLPAVLLVMAALVFGGMVYPLFGGIFTRGTVQTPIGFYNYTFSILGLLVLLMLGICPGLFSGKKSSLIPGAAAGILLFIVLSCIDRYSFLTNLSLAICVMLTVNLLICIMWSPKKLLTDKRFLSFLILHLSIIIMALGITGSRGMMAETEKILGFGDSVELKEYTVQYEQLDWRQEQGKTTAIASVVIKGPRGTERLKPELSYYQKRGIKHARAVIKAGVGEDLYIIFEGLDESDRILLKVMVMRWVCLVWAGGSLMVIGAILQFVFKDAGSKSYYFSHVSLY